MIRIYTGSITDPKSQLVDENMTLGDAIAKFNLVGEVTLNGSSLSSTNRKTTLKDLGIAQDDYLCAARKNGGN